MNTSLFVVTKFLIRIFFLSVLNRIPASNVLARLAKEIPDCWQELGVELDVNKSVIQNILLNIIEFPKPNQKAHEMLVKWSQMTDSPTYGKLVEALREIRRHDLAVWLIDGESAQSMDKIGFLSDLLFFFTPYIYFLCFEVTVECRYEDKYFRVSKDLGDTRIQGPKYDENKGIQGYCMYLCIYNVMLNQPCKIIEQALSPDFAMTTDPLA